MAARAIPLFVGNIPYDITEAQMSELFSKVAPIISFRLVTDRETGKSKGYGFCDYRDPNCAYTALRMLNGYEINGRSLRVDFADEKGTEKREELIRYQGRIPQLSPSSPLAPMPTVAGPNIAGAGMLGAGAGGMAGPNGGGMALGSTGISAGDSLQSYVGPLLDSLTSSHMYEIMIQLKGISQKNPDKVRSLLLRNPAFSYALLKTQVLLGMVNQEITKQIFPSNPPSPSPLIQPNVSMMPSSSPSIPGMNSNFQQNYPTQAPFSSPSPQMIPGISNPTSTLGVVGDLATVLGEEQRALLEHVMQMTPDQIEKLQPQERKQINELRQTVMALNW